MRNWEWSDWLALVALVLLSAGLITKVVLAVLIDTEVL